MPEKDEGFPPRGAVERKLQDLLSGRIAREGASAWAAELALEGHPRVTDMAAWDALSALAMSDGKDADDDGYLYNNGSFLAWLEALRASPQA